MFETAILHSVDSIVDLGPQNVMGKYTTCSFLQCTVHMVCAARIVAGPAGHSLTVVYLCLFALLLVMSLQLMYICKLYNVTEGSMGCRVPQKPNIRHPPHMGGARKGF